MLEFEKIVTISEITEVNKVINIAKINKIGTITIQALNGNTSIKYNNKLVEIKKTVMFEKVDLISNMNITCLDSGIKLYILIKYKKSLEHLN
ncbi:hypothetical protein [uncultured Clostridium sp.]|uniref:hypothetical protein n=1 Tax=uncultured Clostridium sp. TaxID=59620 RepID=UPI002628888C|nr:hypothetical protein [uncultured Clostridium sp.]